MTKEEFGLRLSKLRLRKGISAREMSLSLGQNAGYINSIERGKSFPTMGLFFLICDQLDITPMDFFNTEQPHPAEAIRLLQYWECLTDKQAQDITGIVEELAASNQVLHNRRRR